MANVSIEKQKLQEFLAFSDFSEASLRAITAMVNSGMTQEEVSEFFSRANEVFFGNPDVKIANTSVEVINTYCNFLTGIVATQSKNGVVGDVLISDLALNVKLADFQQKFAKIIRANPDCLTQPSKSNTPSTATLNGWKTMIEQDIADLTYFKISTIFDPIYLQNDFAKRKYNAILDPKTSAISSEYDQLRATSSNEFELSESYSDETYDKQQACKQACIEYLESLKVSIAEKAQINALNATRARTKK